jgi:spermidine synthase
MRIRLAFLLALFAASPLFAAERLLYETDSLYHHIIVSEDDTTRVLRFHKGAASQALDSDFAQSTLLLADPYALNMAYTRYSMVGVAAVDKPARALFVGLGAGTLPKYFAKKFPECQVDVAELDPKVYDVAKKYFFFPDLPNLKVTILDGRLFIKDSKDKYDFIMLDAYRDDMIPFHLMTREFLEQARALLSENGVLISNVAIESSAQLYPWLLRTYQSVFPSVLAADVRGSINKVILCRAAANAFDVQALIDRARDLQSRRSIDFDLPSMAAAFHDESTKRPSPRVLTDDFAPVNLMRIRKADEKDWKYE